jgi:hypothetical protein|tara:strand:+ start:1342 stop:1710 length:369 start_codon:yes stop_codon:yes gene_type:complete
MNELTLECMMNPSLYDKYKTTHDPIYEKQREKDIEKYKPKIIHTTKLMFTHNSTNETLNNSFNHYVDECISTYKAKELHKKPLPEHSPYQQDISLNYILQEHNKTITMDKFIKKKKKSNNKI